MRREKKNGKKKEGEKSETVPALAKGELGLSLKYRSANFSNMRSILWLSLGNLKYERNSLN
jgi:hypothetical protein